MPRISLESYGLVPSKNCCCNHKHYSDLIPVLLFTIFILKICSVHLVMSGFILLKLFNVMIYHITIISVPETNEFPFQSGSSQGFPLTLFFLVAVTSDLFIRDLNLLYSYFMTISCFIFIKSALEIIIKSK